MEPLQGNKLDPIIPKEQSQDPPTREADEKIKKTAGTKISDLPPGGGTIVGKIKEFDKRPIYERRSPEETYNHVVERLPVEVQDQIGNRIKQLSKVEETIEKFAKTEQWDPNNSIYASQDHDYYALEALRKGAITQHQHATLRIFKTELEKQKELGVIPKVMSVFNKDGKVNDKALELIEQGMYAKSFSEAWDYTHFEISKKDPTTPSHLNEKQRENFFKILAAMPKSEQQFLLVPEEYMNEEDSERYEKDHDTKTVTMAINYELDFNVFDRVLIKNDSTGEYELYRMVPSVGMMQAFLDAPHENRTVYIDPILGDCSADDLIEDTMIPTKKMGLQFPLAPQKAIADTFDAPYNDFSRHDFYHAWVCSWIPFKHREKVGEATYLFDDMRSSQPILELIDKLVDLEFLSYLPLKRPEIPAMLIYKYGIHKKQYTDGMIFWLSLAENIFYLKNDPPEDVKTAMTRLVQHFAIDRKGEDAGITAAELVMLKEIANYRLEPTYKTLQQMNDIYESLLKT